MGPLLPFAILFGGLWYLDKDKQPQSSTAAAGKVAPPRYSKMAVSAITEMRGDIRSLKPTELDLSAFSLEPIESPPGTFAFKMLGHVEFGSISADKVVQQALGEGLCALVSLSVVLAEPGTQPMALMLCKSRDAAKYANPNTHLALLAMPAPPAPPVEVVDTPKPAKKRNGLTKAPEPAVDDGWTQTVTLEPKAEA